MLGAILHLILGLTVLLGIAWLFSYERRSVSWRLVLTGLGLQVLFAIFVIMVPFGATVFKALSSVFVGIINFTQAGASFIFGDLANINKFGFVFAFQVLPTIIFFSSLMAVLYHLGIMQKIVAGMAWVMMRAMRVSGAESLSVAANVFIGQTEAPLVVRPYVNNMTRSELLTLMIGGMATIAGGVLAAYVGLLGGGDPEKQLYFATHLLSASIMAAPASMVMAKILLPEMEHSMTMGAVRQNIEQQGHNVIDAAANGAANGVKLALNVAAMLLAFLALIAMIDAPLAWLGDVTGFNTDEQTLSLSLILGYLFSPIMWLIGTPWQDAVVLGGLVGQKVVANEFVAYVQLGQLRDSLTPQSQLIATYALCGFANFSSIAIQIGGIGSIAPERRADLASFGLRAVLGGTLVSLMTATIANFLNTLSL